MGIQLESVLIQDPSQQYGYEKGRVSHIVYIYPRLKDAKLHARNFSNLELSERARVERDAFRYALAIKLSSAEQV
jgi:hypothetical protein